LGDAKGRIRSEGRDAEDISVGHGMNHRKIADGVVRGRLDKKGGAIGAVK
jgi:hypothetical protein